MMSNDNNEVKDVITEETEAVEKTEDSENLTVSCGFFLFLKIFLIFEAPDSFLSSVS